MKNLLFLIILVCLNCKVLSQEYIGFLKESRENTGLFYDLYLLERDKKSNSENTYHFVDTLGLGFTFAKLVDAKFSIDGKFVYVLLIGSNMVKSFDYILYQYIIKDDKLELQTYEKVLSDYLGNYYFTMSENKLFLYRQALFEDKVDVIKFKNGNISKFPEKFEEIINKYK